MERPRAPPKPARHDRTPLKPAAVLRTSPTDFQVEEIPAYAPSGQGTHLFLRVRKIGLNTLECVRQLARRYEVDPRDIGYAGMKDRHAVTIQWISLPWAMARDDDPGDPGIAGLELLEAKRHGNKLRTGHLEGNRFRIILRDIRPVAELTQVADALRALSSRGIANAFGPQRFGRDGSNPERALGWIRGQHRGPSAPRDKRLLISSLQSLMFDDVLRRRVADGTWDTALEGDLLQKAESGGVFPCTDPSVDAARIRSAEVSATGPMFGSRMRWPTGRPEQIEREVLAERLGDEKVLERFGKLGEGTRRALRVVPGELAVETLADDASALVVTFTLPKGSYATVLLAEACEVRDATRPGQDRDSETSSEPELLQEALPGSE